MTGQPTPVSLKLVDVDTGREVIVPEGVVTYVTIIKAKMGDEEIHAVTVYAHWADLTKQAVIPETHQVEPGRG